MNPLTMLLDKGFRIVKAGGTHQVAINLECSREVLAALRKEYVPTLRVKELVTWLLDDPLLSGDQESDGRLLLSFNKYWSDKEHRWIIPTNESRKRIMNAALKGLRARLTEGDVVIAKLSKEKADLLGESHLKEVK